MTDTTPREEGAVKKGPKGRRSREEEYHGIAASRGIAIGECYAFVKESELPLPEKLEPEKTEAEVERFLTALGRSEKELKKIERVTIKKLGKGYSNLFQAQIMMLHDPVLTEAVTRRIRCEMRPANVVIEEEFSRYLELFRSSDDELFRERADDMQDIKDRIIRNLHVRKLHSWIPEGVIVASSHLSPADIILLSRSNIKGFVTDTGGKTSHISLICKSLKIPMVVGLGKLSQKVVAGRRMILDGSTGTVILDPTEKTLSDYTARQLEEQQSEADESETAVQPATTKCGVRIGFYSNIDFHEELDAICRAGAEGVGLFRSENLFTDASKVPTESEQERYYFRMADAIAPMPLDIRLFDIGGDKLMYSPVKEPNPNLGWRGVRILLDLPEILESQLTAIIKANLHGNIDILVPMVISLEEIAEVRAIVERLYLEISEKCTRQLEKPGLGVMIEVPAAVELIEEITRAVDFISIGTNDLTQYTLAVDRNNVIVQDLFEKFHPSLIRQLHRIISTAQRNRCKAVICGDMGSDPLALPFLLGCGLRHFSTVSSDIAKLKAQVGRYTLEECEALALECLRLTSAQEIRERLEACQASH
ncbi:phosphoenolpyruvate--protein phosphotransferase [Chlorobium sp. N1]|uniref:phosphoenolpyruvate--protein phosphotransferase n=1 Tax=Chlorobium sp. N1 TaxID=2491138 RepID=UPI00103CDE72|nr:phosphoenolpyruvate--protein phosphotransferase [Chlorobium sp. N1]TCD47990.1 phosphoenolpyruvate--protein phosphotransferase [Chlorobium sp. N1]